MSDKHIDFEELSAYVDAEAGKADASKIEAHLAQCPTCHKQVAEMRQLGTAIQSLERPEPGAAFTASVMEQLVAQDQNTPVLARFRRAWGRDFRHRGAAAMAAAVLALLAGAWFFSLALFSGPSDSPGSGHIAVVETEWPVADFFSEDFADTLNVALLAESFYEDSDASEGEASLVFATEPTGYDQVLESLEEITYEELVLAVAATLPHEGMDYDFYEVHTDVWDHLMLLDDSAFSLAIEMLDEYLTRG